MHPNFKIAAYIAIPLALAGGAIREQHILTAKAIWNRLTKSSTDSADNINLQKNLLQQANHQRLANRLPPLELDHALDAWLQKNLSPEDNWRDVNAIAATLQQAFPKYKSISLSQSNAATPEAVQDQLFDFIQDQDPALTHLASITRPARSGIGYQALAILGQKLFTFTPELLYTSKEQAFFNTCPHCSTPHLSQAPRHQESFTLDCPSCELAYALVASDNHGRYFYANEFLTGYQPPAQYPKNLSRTEMLITIWRAVHANCRYVNDPETPEGKTDRWQTALETQTLGRGDCEDSSIYLADWLIARGFDARVVMGDLADIGGHAWVVVRLNDEEYLLESTTLVDPDLSVLPLARELQKNYLPEVLFDRWAIYVKRHPQLRQSADYWDPDHWIRLELTRPADAPVIDLSPFARIPSQSPQHLQQSLLAPAAFSPISAPELKNAPLEPNPPSQLQR